VSHEDTQATFDVADPHGQATFRAEVLGLQDGCRVHLDVHVEPDRKQAEVDRLAGSPGLGAKLIATHDDRGPLTYVLHDPEGNEFCLH